jgi:hypothetical protein
MEFAIWLTLANLTPHDKTLVKNYGKATTR